MKSSDLWKDSYGSLNARLKTIFGKALCPCRVKRREKKEERKVFAHLAASRAGLRISPIGSAAYSLQGNSTLANSGFLSPLTGLKNVVFTLGTKRPRSWGGPALRGFFLIRGRG
jgi:hypothetical protein